MTRNFRNFVGKVFLDSLLFQVFLSNVVSSTKNTPEKLPFSARHFNYFECAFDKVALKIAFQTTMKRQRKLELH